SFFFFFSSRRRHTRSDRDWSSDVCSSDLPAASRNPGRALRLRCAAPRRHELLRDLRPADRRVGGQRESLMPATGTPSPTRAAGLDRKSTRLNSSHDQISYAVFCLKKKKTD